VRLIILKFYTMQDGVVLIWQVVDDIVVDDVDTLHAKRMTCSES
jgi:hypothetical protein